MLHRHHHLAIWHLRHAVKLLLSRHAILVIHVGSVRTIAITAMLDNSSQSAAEIMTVDHRQSVVARRQSQTAMVGLALQAKIAADLKVQRHKKTGVRTPVFCWF